LNRTSAICRAGIEGVQGESKRKRTIMGIDEKIIFACYGHCSTCERDTRFVAYDAWFRDYFVCSHCGSLPRERALMVVIDRWFPGWRDAVIHESSPGPRGASARLARRCQGYIASQFFPDQAGTPIVGGVRNENLERLSFPDASVDLHITQDVFGHVFDPDRAFLEIARTLRPGGMHIFTVPLVKKHAPSCVRARLVDGAVEHLSPAEYHGNPVGDGRALVTVDWGYDICDRIFRSCGLFTYVVHIDDLEHGIRADYIEVLVTTKPA